MKTVELAYWSVEGTHFLATPNLVIGASAPVTTDNAGKKFNIVAFSKNWDNCVAQAKEQVQYFIGGEWKMPQEFQAGDSGVSQHDLATLINAPQMALMQSHG